MFILHQTSILIVILLHNLNIHFT